MRETGVRQTGVADSGVARSADPTGELAFITLQARGKSRGKCREGREQVRMIIMVTEITKLLKVTVETTVIVERLYCLWV